MSPTLLFGVQFTFSLVLSAIVARWYVVPALKKLPVHAALAPGQIGDAVPSDAMAAIAYGDLASAVLALVAALFLHYRVQGAIAVAWVVNVVTSLDWLYASFLAATNQLATYPMGSNWYIINYYVPAIAVVHVLIFARLLKESHALETSRARLSAG